jgi:sulfate permease, SulP family
MNAKQILLDASAGLLSGAMRVLGAVSIATLLFPGNLSELFLTGVSIGVVTVVAGNIVAGIRNEISYVTYATDYAPIFLFSVVATALFSELPASQRVPAIMLFIILTSITTGLVFFLIGHFKLSNLARFVPFPVVAGFMAGIGLLIVFQSLGSLAKISPTWDSVPRFFSINAILHWAPGLAFALVMMFGGKIIRTTFFPQLAIGLAISIFLAILSLTHTPISVAYENGWSAAPVNGNLPFEFYVASVWGIAPPITLLSHFDIFATIIGVSLLSVLITLTGLEVSAKQEMRFERELKDAGLANIASGLLGGAITYQSVSSSMMNYKMGGRTRLVPILTGSLALVFLFFGWGAGVIRYLPIAVLSGLVLYVGLEFVQEWLLESRKRMTAVEYCLLVAIAFTIVVSGVITGVALGIAVATLLFTITYTQLRCIYMRQTGKSLRSNVERAAIQEAILATYDDHIRLFRLQGYLFFGSAEKIGETVKHELRQHRFDPDVPLSVVLDFQSVSGVDSSATMTFAKIFETARGLGVRIMLINTSSSIEAVFRRAIGPDVMSSVSMFLDQDLALETRENSILDAVGQEKRLSPTARDVLSQFGFNASEVDELMGFFRRHDVSATEVLFRKGEKADSMLIVDSGEFEVYLETPNGDGVRLRKVLAGASLGEMGIYLGTQRTASVRATTDGRVIVLDEDGLARMHTQRPALAHKFNHFIISVLCGRLSHSNDEIFELSSRRVQ